MALICCECPTWIRGTRSAKVEIIQISFSLSHEPRACLYLPTYLLVGHRPSWRISVTRFDKISLIWQSLKSLWPIFIGFLLYLAKFWTFFVQILYAILYAYFSVVNGIRHWVSNGLLRELASLHRWSRF